MCQRLRLFYLLLAVLLLLPLVLFSEQKDPATMTDQEILTELIQSNERKREILNEREAELNERESRLNEREIDFQKRIDSWTAINNFSQSLREEIKSGNRAEYWRGFKDGVMVGGSLGFGSGLYGGIKIGVRF